MIKIEIKQGYPYQVLLLQHSTNGYITPEGSLVPPVVTEAILEIPISQSKSATWLIEEIKTLLDDTGMLYQEEEDGEDWKNTSQ